MSDTDKTNYGQIEVLTEVIKITRDQLSRSLNLNAELEALLTVERRRREELEKTLSESKPDEKSSKP